ncbi:putative gibberellin 3-beta hydroxylase [Lophiotrema nucula]|uniref:Putative gibberellin 3-beta hydroxylase n=1 Tax=Lophiotrema nucula TaxID=690887 RepID=A0A6A5ZV57_9PLEO|nr:putative gibberellin 3-beta hydroxylase [Lophiotrema nucula]
MATTTTATEPRRITLSNGKSFTVTSNSSSNSESIPLIDVSRMYSEKLEDRQALAEEIRNASREIGFFTIVNHGVDMKLAKEAFEQAKLFFARPLEEKMQVCTDVMPEEFCGYHPMERYNWEGSKRKDLHEAFNWNYNAARDPDLPDTSIPEINLWPKGAIDFQEKLCTYQSALISLARKLTRIFALALHLPEDAFDDFVRQPEAGMRILRYPEQTASRDDQTGIGSHTDVECFTIVTQDSPGLEVLSKSGGWIKVQPVKDAFVVNIADCFMRQTNDFFVSTIHRVINENGKERYSVPFFWGFNRGTVLNPVVTCVSEENPNKYPVMTAGEYYAWRTKRQKMMGMSDRTA